MWIELISNLTDRAEFATPVSDDRLARDESVLATTLPDDLKNLLRESNGMAGEYGLGLIWDIDRIEHDNLQPELFTSPKIAFRSSAQNPDAII